MAERESTDMTDVYRSEPGDSILDPVFVAAGLGIGGPLLAIAFGELISALDAAVGVPALLALLLLVVTGQYVAFGGLALGYLRSRGLEWSAVRDYLGVRVPSLRDLLAVLGGWALIFGSIFVIFLIVQVTGASPAENEAGRLARDVPALIPPLIIAMFLVVGPSEEVLYRGVVQGRLRESFGPVPAIVLASAIFASIHWMALAGDSSARLLTVAILFVPSLVFGAVYEYTGNLVASILLHAIHNSVLLALLYVALKYGPEQTGTLLQALAF